MKPLEEKVKREAVLSVLSRIGGVEHATRVELFMRSSPLCSVDWQKATLNRLARAGLIEKVPGTMSRSTKWRAVRGAERRIDSCIANPRILTEAMRGNAAEAVSTAEVAQDANVATREATETVDGVVESMEEVIFSDGGETDAEDVDVVSEEMVAGILKISYANMENLVDLRKTLSELRKRFDVVESSIVEALNILRQLQ